MRNEAIFFTKEAIVEFLRSYGRPKSKDYEFAAALIMHRRCEKQWGEKCWIGFRIKEAFLNDLPTIGSEKVIGLSDIEGLLHNRIDEDSPVDFVIARKINIRKALGLTFQTKRFGIGRIKKDTDELIAYLNDLFSKKYGKTNEYLLICLDDLVDINVEKLKAGVNTAKSPFKATMFTWLNDGKINLKDMFPEGVTETYSLVDIFHT